MVAGGCGRIHDRRISFGRCVVGSVLCNALPVGGNWKRTTKSDQKFLSRKL